MLMTVMHIGIVRMGMLQRLMHMDVRVRFRAQLVLRVPMLVVCIMDMRVFVFRG